METRKLPYLCIIFLCISLGFSKCAFDSEVPRLSEVVNSSARNVNSERSVQSMVPGRSLLSLTRKNQDTVLVAALDGTIHLVESNSGNILWSFNSGPPIYSSYQSPRDHYTDSENTSGLSRSVFFDCGDDWELYLHDRHIGEKVKLKVSIEEVIKTTPQILEDGGIMLGSKRTTVFSVDAVSGRVINTFHSPDSSFLPQSNPEKPFYDDGDVAEWTGSISSKLFPLFITRIDYSLHAFAPNSKKVLWNMTVSEIGASLLCQDSESLSDQTPIATRYDLDEEFDDQFKFPLSCQSKAIVYRFRGRNLIEFLSGHEPLPEKEGSQMVLEIPNSHNLLSLQSKNSAILEKHHDDVGLPFRSSRFRFSSLNKAHELQDYSYEDTLPTLLPTELMHPLQSRHGKLTNVFQNNRNEVVLQADPEYSKTHHLRHGILFFIILFLIFVGVVIITCRVGDDNKPISSVNIYKDKNIVPKKKKSRKSGKKNGHIEKSEALSPEKEKEIIHMIREINAEKLVEGVVNGKKIGRLLLTNIEIAKGSNGTVVLQGNHEGRPVAVKRLVRAHHDVAVKEIENLIASDQHPNIVRWYGVEYDQDFVYLSLERCACSLSDLVQPYSDDARFIGDQIKPSGNGILELGLINADVRGITLWEENDHPSSFMLKLMRDMVSGLVHLHDLGIVHRDLKPQNVLIIKERYLSAKLSDMGISKRLSMDTSSISNHSTGHGSSGWQAPEQLRQGRQTRAVDLFSLGCILFFCMTRGKHPFGDYYERDTNIWHGKFDLFLVTYFPEAVDLLSRLLNSDPEMRPMAKDVLHHPLFWSSEVRLSFLRDTSDRIELEGREGDSDLLKAFESTALVAFGRKWDEKMETAFIANIGHYRRYRYDSIRDLLRVMRNKLNHYRELPSDIQEILGPVPDGFNTYFLTRFPNLLMEVYKVVSTYCSHEHCFRKYFYTSLI